MMDVPEHIRVNVTTSPSRRERIEQAVLARQAAHRVANVAVVEPALSRWSPRWLALGGLAVAGAIIAVVLTRGSAAPPSFASSPTHVVTPVGGGTRFIVDDAVIDAQGDTSVEVQPTDHDGVTLALARGSVDCDVAPRHGRPFLVIAGDVTVEVVGTRFTVARSATCVRVDVARGKVRVHSSTGEYFVVAGETWSNGAIALAPSPAVTIVAPPAIAAPVAVVPTPPTAPRDSRALKPITPVEPAIESEAPVLDTKQADRWIAEGEAQLAAGNFDEADIAFKRAVAADSTAHAAFAGRAEVAYNEGDFMHAILLAKHAVALASQLVPYKMTLAKAYFKLMRYEDAIEQWQEVIDLDPSNGTAKENIEMATAKMGH